MCFETIATTLNTITHNNTQHTHIMHETHTTKKEMMHSSEGFEGDFTDCKSYVGMADYSETPYNVNGEYYCFCVGLYAYGRNYCNEWVSEAPHLFLTEKEAYEFFLSLCRCFNTVEEIV